VRDPSLRRFDRIAECEGHTDTQTAIAKTGHLRSMLLWGRPVKISVVILS